MFTMNWVDNKYYTRMEEKKMETISLFNGNEQRYKQDMPTLTYLTEYINPVALKHIEKNTGLKFKKVGWGYTAKPKTSKQVLKLLLTYNFRTQYHNNATTKNTIFLKGCDGEIFKGRSD